ncbi:hypothetical protein [Hymenobacter sp. IS2118]|uniref:hypothetical protein n=1 Tax=Hymenobacter sp. IS2118 TaxID=1505605 RepID=UPI000A97C879|nr:hypothetical protein [Hymenobacter sp. IS2118]
MKRLFLLLLATALSSCRKQPAECPQLTRAPQAFLDYWYFPKGSTWVYQLRGTSPAVYDTMRVSFARESHSTRYSDGDKRVPCVQGYQASVTHSNRTYFPGAGGLGTEYLASDPLFRGEDWVLTHTSSVGTLYSPEVGFGYPIRLGQKLLDRLTFADTAAVTTPAGTFAHSVHLIPDYGSKVDSTKRNWIRHLYYSRYVGTTKVVYTNNQTWELLTYKIPR